tara:strand:- start:3156 stop:3263 length:108 start_codon:yes stop_codon:yes gene_type:complete
MSSHEPLKMFNNSIEGVYNFLWREIFVQMHLDKLS